MLDTRITAVVASLRFTSLNATVAESYSRRSEPNLDKSGIVYSKPPFGGPEYVLHYLGRYTHRVAISNHRLISFEDGQAPFVGATPLTTMSRS
jgi:hypothetical protein